MLSLHSLINSGQSINNTISKQLADHISHLSQCGTILIFGNISRTAPLRRWVAEDCEVLADSEKQPTPGLSFSCSSCCCTLAALVCLFLLLLPHSSHFPWWAYQCTVAVHLLLFAHKIVLIYITAGLNHYYRRNQLPKNQPSLYCCNMPACICLLRILKIVTLPIAFHSMHYKKIVEMSY